MAYSTSSPPVLVAQGIGGVGKLWYHEAVDALTAVDAAGYFTNGYDLGMRAKDHIIHVDNDASPLASSIHMVNASSSTSTDLNDGTAITATDSD